MPVAVFRPLLRRTGLALSGLFVVDLFFAGQCLPPSSMPTHPSCPSCRSVAVNYRDLPMPRVMRHERAGCI